MGNFQNLIAAAAMRSAASVGTAAPVCDLAEQIAEFKHTVAEAAAHPFLPQPARAALLQATAIIERIALEQQKVSELLLEELQVREARQQFAGGDSHAYAGG